MVMKMEAAVYAKTPTRLHKTVILNKIYNTTVYWLVTLFCSQAACTINTRHNNNLFVPAAN